MGMPPPLRLFVETIAAIRTKVREHLHLDEAEEKGMKRNLNDWGRVRAPWIGHRNSTDQNGPTERMKYFGWTWDSTELAEISVACKGDDAKVNLALWAVGGDSERHERARVVTGPPVALVDQTTHTRRRPMVAR